MLKISLDFKFVIFLFIYCSLQGAQCLAQSLKVVNEALTSLDLGFNEIRVQDLGFSLLSLKKKAKICFFL